MEERKINVRIFKHDIRALRETSNDVVTTPKEYGMYLRGKRKKKKRRNRR